jgi:hypothetical protein
MMKPLMNLKNVVRERLDQKVVSERGALPDNLSEISDVLDTITKERDDLSKKLDDIWNGRIRDRILHHHPHRVAGKVVVVDKNTDADDQNLVYRVTTAYRKSIRTSVGSTRSVWLKKFADVKSYSHNLLKNGDIDSIGRMLRDPASSMLFHGFESIQKEDVSRNNDPTWVDWQRQLTYDNLLQIARAIGLRRVENPETGLEFDDTPEVESILEQLDSAFGFRIEFPNLFAGEIGLETSRGVANYRSIQALYQAWRIRHILLDTPNPRVLEIGAGLGRTAFFAMKMGISSYTIIDIPLTGVSQGYFLGRVLGEDAISLYGEHTGGPVQILPPIAFHQGSERFDLIVNVDSMPEMAEFTAREYFNAASSKCSHFLSINHEHNAFTVAQNYQRRDDVRVSRTPCWLRRGYVEELIEFVSPDALLSLTDEKQAIVESWRRTEMSVKQTNHGSADSTKMSWKMKAMLRKFVQVARTYGGFSQ